MPDSNKLQVLKEAGYRLLPTCGTCKHANFVRGCDWGVCQLRIYSHKKHTQPRKVSIHFSGSCGDHELSEASVQDLGASGFMEFVK